MKNNTNLYKNC